MVLLLGSVCLGAAGCWLSTLSWCYYQPIFLNHSNTLHVGKLGDDAAWLDSAGGGGGGGAGIWLRPITQTRLHIIQKGEL